MACLACTGSSWKNLLESGKTVAIRLYLVPIPLDSQSHWGTINPGSTYLLRSFDGAHYAYGYNRGTKNFGTWKYPKSEQDDILVVWGHSFVFDDKTGEVRDKNPAIFSGVCGQLEFPREFESAFVYGNLAN